MSALTCDIRNCSTSAATIPVGAASPDMTVVAGEDTDKREHVWESVKTKRVFFLTLLEMPEWTGQKVG